MLRYTKILAKSRAVVSPSHAHAARAAIESLEARRLLAFSPAVPEFRVNTYTDSNQSWSSVGLDASGAGVAVWESTGQDGDAGGIYAQRFNPSGTPIGSEFRVNTTTVGNQAKPAV